MILTVVITTDDEEYPLYALNEALYEIQKELEGMIDEVKLPLTLEREGDDTASQLFITNEELVNV